MLLLFHNTGPMIRYENGLLLINDLNPESKMQWRMSRWEMFKLGCMCMLTVLRLRPTTPTPDRSAPIK